jgi:hypothetical protein
VGEALKHAENLRSIAENKVIVELRTKLEVRTWFLRASLALNIALVAGLVVRLVS